MPRSLRMRLLLAVILVEVIAVAQLIPATLNLVEQNAHRLSQQRLRETVPLLTEALGHLIFQRDLATIEKVLSGIVNVNGLATVRVLDQSGTVLVERVASMPSTDVAPSRAGLELIESPVLLAGQPVGAVQVYASTAFLAESRRAVVVQALSIAGVGLVVGILALGLIAVLITRDLARLRSGVTAVTHGDWSVRLPERGAEEVQATARAFNQMLARLEESRQLVLRGEAQYRYLVEESQQPVMVLEHRKPVYANAAYAHLLGFDSPTELLATESIDAFIAPEAVTEAAERSERRIRSEPTPHRYVVPTVTRQGERKWLDVIATKVRWGGRDAFQVVAFDITERVQAQAALQEAEQRLRMVIQHAPLILYVLDRDGTFLLSEGRGLESLGRAQGEVVGQSAFNVFAHLPERVGLIERALRGEAFAAAVQVGGQFLDSYHQPLFDDQGQVSGLIVVSVDSTKRNVAEMALRESEARFRNLIEGSLQGVMVLNDRWRVEFANQAAADIYGYEAPEELLALPTAGELIVPEDREMIRAYNRDRRAGLPRPTYFVHRGLRKDGAHIWVQSYVRVVEWAGRTAVQVTLIDITEQRLAESELQRSEAKFRALIESSLLATTITDESWKLVFINEAAARLYGYDSAEEALAAIKSVPDVIYEGDIEMLRSYRAARFAGEEVPSRYEFRARRRDGRLLWLQNIVSMVEWEGRKGTMSISLDITAHKMREDELRQAQKMEVVGQLTGGVAHDFNNLLTVVMGNLELMRYRVRDDPKLLELVDSAAVASERGSTLTQRLLAFSRKQALQPESVDVNRLVAGIEDLIRRTLGETIQVESVLAGGLWPAFVDPNQLENALLNLAINSRDAMPTGGRLTIETANTRLDDEYAIAHEEVHPGQYVMLAVSDTGEGMTHEVVARAFEPFFTTKEVGRGSGLGLSMIYGFAKQSDGHVKIYSEPGQGTTVRIYLPRSSSQAGARRASMYVAPALGTQQEVLVVEDDDAVRELAISILGNLGYVPLPAPDGPAALLLLEQHPDVALLFTDVVLSGGMSGVELAREARRRRPELKVLYTSGYTENAIIHHGRLDDDVELLEKPYRIDSLAQKLRRILTGD